MGITYARTAELVNVTKKWKVYVKKNIVKIILHANQTTADIDKLKNRCRFWFCMSSKTVFCYKISLFF